MNPKIIEKILALVTEAAKENGRVEIRFDVNRVYVSSHILKSAGGHKYGVQGGEYREPTWSPKSEFSENL